jgi:two-component system chemotaxis response regulator CheB
MIRVLVCEDSSTARQLLVQILRASPDVEVVGEARDGLEAVELTKQLRPDAVTMDINMPRMDGLAATREIMITAPTPIVIVTGSASINDVSFALDALRAGALAVLPRPQGPLTPGFAEAARKLLETVKTMSQVKVVRHWRAVPSGGPAASGALASARAGQVRAQVVAVAASTGGPAALHQLLTKLPGSFPVPILVVQHITPGFTPGLAAWLQTAGSLAVKVAEHGELLRPRTVYLPPDDWHLGVTRTGAVALSKAPPLGGFRPSGTRLFESVAQAYGAATLAVILTGMGEDGVAGLKMVRQAGGRIIAQDEKSSVIFGMPGAAVAAGLADDVLPLEAIAGQLVQLV